MSTFLRCVGYAWLTIVALLVAIGALGILLTRGLLELLAIFSPFNFWNWALIGVLSLPGIAMIALSKRSRFETHRKLPP